MYDSYLEARPPSSSLHPYSVGVKIKSCSAMFMLIFRDIILVCLFSFSFPFPFSFSFLDVDVGWAMGSGHWPVQGFPSRRTTLYTYEFGALIWSFGLNLDMLLVVLNFVFRGWFLGLWLVWYDMRF